MDKANLDNMAQEIATKRSEESTKKKRDLEAEKKKGLKAELVLTLKTKDINSVEGGKALRQLEFQTKGFPDLNNEVNEIKKIA